MLTLLGVVAIWTSSTETSLGGNERLNKQASYQADAGLQEAIARLDYNNAADPTYYIDTVKDHICASPYEFSTIQPAWAAGKSFFRTDGNTEYSVTITPSFENDSYNNGFHEYTAAPTDQLVLYNKGFNYSDSPISAINNATSGFPVFHIVSIGRVRDAGGNVLATATVQADVTKNTININTPGAVYSGACINFLGNAFTITAPGDVAVSTASTNNCTSPTLSSYSGGGLVSGSLKASTPLLQPMSSFLGVGLAQLKGMATLDYTGSSTETGVSWGNFGSQTNAQVVFVDNACKYTGGNCNPGNFHISGGQGYGILVVTGDLEVSGGFEFKGLVYVMGNLKMTGTGGHVTGSIMVQGTSTNTTDIGGNSTITLNRQILADVSKASFTSKMLSWKQIKN